MKTYQIQQCYELPWKPIFLDPDKPYQRDLVLQYKLYNLPKQRKDLPNLVNYLKGQREHFHHSEKRNQMTTNREQLSIPHPYHNIL